MVEEPDTVVSIWPTLPANCPLAGAAPCDGTFFRLTDSSDPMDWVLPFERHGEDKVATFSSELLCRSHAFSILPTFDAAVEFRNRYGNVFRNHAIVKFRVSPDCGVVLQNKPPNPHHCLWPADAFVVPPETEPAE